MIKIAKYYPYVTSLIIIGILYFIDNDIIKSINFSELTNSAMVVFSVLFGFLLTVSTLLYTIDTIIMRQLRKTDAYSSLLHYLKAAIYASLSVAIISLCMPLFKNSIALKVNLDSIVCIKFIFLYLIFLSLTLSIRFIYVFINTVE